MSCTDAGSPSSAGPHGSASAGEPVTFHGKVSSIIRSRSSRSPTPTGGATIGTVGVTSRSTSSAAIRSR